MFKVIRSMSLFAMLLWFIYIVGYVSCAVKFVNCDFSSKTSFKPEIIYGIGILTGLGGVIGYLDLGK